MLFQSVTSSNIKAVAHDGEDLYIQFNYGGTYRYDSVPRSVFDALLVAESVGKFFHTDIKPNYPYTVVGSEQHAPTGEMTA